MPRRGCGRCSGRWSAVAGGEHQVVAAEVAISDPGSELGGEFGGEAHGAGFVVLGVGLDVDALPVGCGAEWDFDDGLGHGQGAAGGARGEVEVSGTQRDELPQRRPVSIAVSTISRYWPAGTTSMTRPHSSGVRVRRRGVTTLGSSVSSHSKSSMRFSNHRRALSAQRPRFWIG